MTLPKLIFAAIFAITALAGTWSALNAQTPAVTRVPLLDQDLSAAGRHGVQARADIGPGGEVAKHTHPGEELSYIVEGTLQLEVQGQPPRTLKAGESYFIPAGVVHAAKNVDKGVTKVLATYVVEKGKPVASPVN